MTTMTMNTMTDEQLSTIITHQLPRLLKARPELTIPLYRVFLDSLAKRGEPGHLYRKLAELGAAVQANSEQVDRRFERVDGELGELRTEMREGFEQVDQRFEQVDQRFEQVDQRFEQVDQRFEQVDQRFEQVDQRFDGLQTEVREGFKNVERQIDRLGGRWGIRNESLFRETMAGLLEKSFGVKVERRMIRNEEFDVIISDGDHILVEIAASVKRDIKERLERKRTLYVKETGVTPARFILAVASIHSRRAQALREAGFEVIEPDDGDGQTD